MSVRAARKSSQTAEFCRDLATSRAARHSAIERLLLRLQSDSLVRNSLYLVFSSALQASLSFVFWIAAARLFSTDEMGRASSLLSATLFLALLALLGLNTSIVRYLPTSTNRDGLITGGLSMVALCGFVLGALYVLAAPTIAPSLAFVDKSLPLAIGFSLFTATAGVNLLTDAVFIGSHKASYVAITDGAIAGAAKIGALILLAGTGAFGLYAASTAGLAAAALSSIFLIAISLRWRPRFGDSFQALRPLVRFSSANYASELLAIIPQTVLPIIILDRSGPSTAAYYYLSYQVAALAYSTIFAVQSTMLAEGSRAHVQLSSLVKRSVRLTLVVCMPVVLVVILGSRWILLIFGASYSTHATFALIVLVATAVPMAANSTIDSVLRLLGHLTVLVWSSVLFAVTICGLAWLLAPHGLVAVTAAWPISITAAAVPSGVSLLRRRPVRVRRSMSDRFRASVHDTSSPLAGHWPDYGFAEDQQAGLAVLLGLAVAGNTAPFVSRVTDFNLSSARMRTEVDDLSGQSNLPVHFRLGLRTDISRPRPQDASPPDTGANGRQADSI